MTAKLHRQDPEGAEFYDTDIVAWANEQARLLRAGRLDRLDIEHIADKIEDVGTSEQRELANRMADLLAHLPKWQFQPERRGRELGDDHPDTAREHRPPHPSYSEPGGLPE